MSAYLDVDSGGGGKSQHSAPVTLRGRPSMLAWFEDVQVRMVANIVLAIDLIVAITVAKPAFWCAI